MANSPKTLLLMPGLDGTGNLFAEFISALPPDLRAIIVRYPSDRFLPYSELPQFVTSAMPSDARFVMVAESFSTPLAVVVAATPPHNLAGLVICAGFVTSPLEGWLRLLKFAVRPAILRLPMPRLLIDHFLAGADAPTNLQDEVIRTRRSVAPEVIAGRLRAVLACDARKQLAQVAVPTLYLQATADRLVPARCGEEIRHIKADTLLQAIPAPHMLLQRQPQRAVEVIARFIRAL